MTKSLVIFLKNLGFLYQLPRKLEFAKARADELRRESALRESEARYRAVFELSAAGIGQAHPGQKFSTRPM